MFVDLGTFARIRGPQPAYVLVGTTGDADPARATNIECTPIVVDGRLGEPAWTAAPEVGKFVFPWSEGGKLEQTVAKMLWDDTHLYVAFICEDAHIWAVHTERDSRVWRDDTVEVFAAPNPDDAPVTIACIGA